MARYVRGMNANMFYRLDALSVIDVVGSDAAAIVHNLTTNDVKKLSDGEGCESFITDVRGKTLGHVLVFCDDRSIRLIGAGGQSEAIAQHIDRYTIREDAQPVIRDDDYVAVAIDQQGAAAVGVRPFAGDGLVAQTLQVGDHEASAYRTPWLDDGGVVLLLPADHAEAIVGWLAAQRLSAAEESTFHQRRVRHGFPWYGIDLDESNLPQEADRDSQAISLTKGCYLGQETVARLDALGQVQRKLVRWSLQGAVPESGTVLVAGEKQVGRLTSIARYADGQIIAIGYARRSHFDPGAVAEWTDEASGTVFPARVV